MGPTILTTSSFLIIIIIQCIVSSGANEGHEFMVQTDCGYVKGITVKTPTEKDVDAFLGIPYADPPTGPNRFRAPQPKQPWQGVYHADRILNACAQLELGNNSKPPSANSSELEDCLYLNVWTPKPRKEPLPVMVFIHGGGFQVGSAGNLRLNGGTLASEEDVIVVTLNYRLHVFGFLYMEGTDAPGNIGLLDQVAALQWVQRNIANFGGDPQRVTLFGISAGGGSIGLHLLSEKSKNLFQSAIMESGTGTMLKINKDIHKYFVLKLAKSLNCPHDPKDRQAIVDCLRSVPKEELLTKAKFPGQKVIWGSPFLPVGDGEFLKHDPHVLQTQKEFNDVNVMIGSTSEDGATFPLHFPIKLYVATEDFLPNRTGFESLTKQFLRTHGDLPLKLIQSMYTDWSAPDDPKTVRVQMAHLFTDYFLNCGINELCQDLTMAGKKVYRYQFSHIPSTFNYPKWMGSVHMAELDFVFGNVLDPSTGYTKQEMLISKQIMKYWTNFAKYGDPNGQHANREVGHPEWPRYTLYSKDYLNINNATTAAQNGIRLRVCAFWKQIFPNIERLSIS